MSPDDFRAQLEEDLGWRRDEMRLLRNQLGNLTTDVDRRRYRKSLVVMMYSHFEGFCKLAFSAYAQAVNDEGITCGDANGFIAAASLADVFSALADPNKKCDVFRRTLPDDTQLHRFARQVDFIEVVQDVQSRPVAIPVEQVVDTDANLKPVILRKILYRLGFPPDLFKSEEGTIHMLLERRNNIAHGAQRAGLDSDEYEKIERAVAAVETRVMIVLTAALADRRFLRGAA